METCCLIFFICILYLGNVWVGNNFLSDYRFTVVSVVLVLY